MLAYTVWQTLHSLSRAASDAWALLHALSDVQMKLRVVILLPDLLPFHFPQCAQLGATDLRMDTDLYELFFI